MEVLNLYISLTFSIFLVPVMGQSQRQQAILYSGYNLQGDVLPITEAYVSDLAAVNFDNRAYSACFSGIWILYEEPEYNPKGCNATVMYIFGFGPRKNCVNIPSPQNHGVAGLVSSIRLAGIGSDYYYSTLNLYEELFFQGAEEKTSVDLPDVRLAGNHKSLIITGPSAWTVYPQPNFQGPGICLVVSTVEIGRPRFITDLMAVSIQYGTIRSVRKGC